MTSKLNLAQAICICNQGYEASLEPRKLYNVEDDSKAGALGMLRIIDESGDGYLYPSEMFSPISFKML